MNTRINYIVIYLLFTSLLLAQKQAEIQLNANAIHPRYREWVNLSNGNTASVNPPALLFPAAKGSGISYCVKLSQNKDFPVKTTIKSELIPWAMFSPHQVLNEGGWYWKFETYEKGKLVSVSDKYFFKVEKQTRTFQTPSINNFLIKTNVDHPRLYVQKSEMPVFRAVNKDDEEAKAMIRRADKQLKASLPVEAPTRPRDTTGMNQSEKDIMMSFMYHSFGDKVKEPIKDLCMSYFLTGNEAYIHTAIRQALHLSEMDMNGVATSDDFNSASVMLAMAVAYDSGYEFLTPTEKKRLKEAITLRGRYFFNQYVNEFETHSMDNHVWQHTLRRFMFTSIAMLNDIPEAKTWLSYCYEVWCCRFPVLGADDGGWHDGSSYFQVNFESFIYIPFVLSKITGVDFFNMPYYKNLPIFMMYSFPKNSFSTGFGDGAEKMVKPTKNYAAFADALARETGSPYAKWYADGLTGGNKSELNKAEGYAIYHLLSNMKPKQNIKAISPEKLPQSKLFRDAGFALMHSNVANPAADVMLNFTSLPFGATGHAHAAHNGFGMNVGGKQMFGGSGYYSNFNDPHTLKHYRTRGHNTFVVNGMSQCIGENGYGWIARFADTDKFTYVLGDATHAYDEMRTPFWIDRMQKSGVAYTLENGFGNPKVTRFRRHFIYLRPNIVIIYDELKAEQPSEWTWLLNSYQQITADNDSHVVFGENSVATSRVDVFSTTGLNRKVHDQFFSPAINWKNKGSEDTSSGDEYKNHWHAEFTTNEKINSCRFLAVFQIKFNNEKTLSQEIKPENGKIQIGDWKIMVEMDGNKAAQLEISDKEGDGIFYNLSGVGKIYGSTVIKTKNKIKEELVDILPAAANAISLN